MNFRRLAGLALWNLQGQPKPLPGEREASIRLYSTEARRVRATPRKRPDAAGHSAEALSTGETYARHES